MRVPGDDIFNDRALPTGNGRSGAQNGAVRAAHDPRRANTNAIRFNTGLAGNAQCHTDGLVKLGGKRRALWLCRYRTRGNDVARGVIADDAVGDFRAADIKT